MKNTTTQTLQATTREQRKKQVRALRKESLVPGVVYGHGQNNQHITLKSKELIDVYRLTGESTLLDLAIDEGTPLKVLVQSIDRNGITDDIEHVDFYAVNMKEAIHTEVPLVFVGEAPAVRELNGVLVKNRDHVAIKCLPNDLISEYEIDVSGLATFEDAIHVSDVKLPDTIEVLDEPELTIATVSPPRTEEELASLDEQVSEDISQVEGAAEDAPTEGEEGAEGAEGDRGDKKEAADKKE